MTIIVTTLALAVAENATQVSLASATGVVGPGPNNSNRQVLWVDREAMEIVSISGVIATVVRGVLGTLRVAHVIGQKVWIGQEADFEHFQGMGLGIAGSSMTRAFETTLPTTAADTATITPAQVLGGLITGTPTAAATYTLPTAALLDAALRSFGTTFRGQSFEFTIKNTSAGANTITVAGGTGGTDVGTMTIAQNSAKRFKVVLTAVDSPAYSVYSLGTVVF